MKGYIYKYTFSDGKVYIGQTRRHPNERNREHFDEIVGKLNPKFWEAYETLGMPDFEILEVVEEERVQDLVPVLNGLETMYIQKYKAANPDFGYNVRDHAFVAVPKDAVLDDVADKLFRKKMGQWQSACETVLTKCLETFEPLTQEELDFCNAELHDEENIFTETLDELHFDFKDLKSNTDEAKFFLEEAADYAEDRFGDILSQLVEIFIEQNKDELLKYHHPEASIVQMDKEGNIVREYASSAEVRETLQRSNITNVFNVLEGRQKTAYGYIWKYKKDIEWDIPIISDDKECDLEK